MIFTMSSVESGRSFCELCSFLWLVGSIAQRYKVGVLSLDPPFGGSSSQHHPPSENEDAMTLATISSQFTFPTSFSTNPGADAAYCAEDAGAMLIVVKGSNTLERKADKYYRNPGFARFKIPELLLRQLSAEIKTPGTWIAEASNDSVFSPCAPLRGRRAWRCGLPTCAVVAELVHRQPLIMHFLDGPGQASHSPHEAHRLRDTHPRRCRSEHAVLRPELCLGPRPSGEIHVSEPTGPSSAHYQRRHHRHAEARIPIRLD